jgi:hypothetical protein
MEGDILVSFIWQFKSMHVAFFVLSSIELKDDSMYVLNAYSPKHSWVPPRGGTRTMGSTEASG